MKKQQEPSRRQIKLANEGFLAFCLKLHERLTIMLDFNFDNKLDPIESDIEVIRELYQMFESSKLEWPSTVEEKTVQNVTQEQLFTDNESEKK